MNWPPKVILAPVDFSIGSRAAFEQAARIAASHDSRLHVLHALDSMALAAMADHRREPFEKFSAESIVSARRSLDEWLKRSPVKHGYEITIAIGVPLHEILEHARAFAADLIVAGISGAGAHPAGAGSVSGKLARKSPVDVLLARSDHPHPFRKIVACIDFSELSPRLAADAAGIAQQDGASVDFVHVWQEPWQLMPLGAPFGDAAAPTMASEPSVWEDLRKALGQELHRFVKDVPLGVPVAEALREDSSYGRGITAYASEVHADLIVIGSKGRTNLRYVLLGSTAERLLTTMPCSLLVVKPPA